MKKILLFITCIISSQIYSNEIPFLLVENIDELPTGKEIYLYEDQNQQETIETIKN